MRDLAFAEAEQKAMMHHLPESQRQAIHGCDDGAAVVSDNDERLGGWGRTPRAGIRHQPLIRPFPPLPPSDPIQGLVANYPEQPRSEGLVGPESIEGAKGLHESILCHFFGVLGVAHDEVGHPERDLLMGVDELSEGTTVTGARLDNQVPFFKWTALHAVSS